jgi:hypothetical protein
MATIRYCDFCGEDLSKYAGRPFEGAGKNQISGIATTIGTNPEVCKRCLNKVTEKLNEIQAENEEKLKGRIVDLKKYDID